MELKRVQINPNRLEQSIEVLAAYGRNKMGGLDRTTFTSAELDARNWLKQQLKEAGLCVRVDAAANIWGKRIGVKDIPCIVFGSHIDTVPNGGKYDGALGVLVALEVMKVLKENSIETYHPLELVSFSAEEPNPFGLSTFGSRAISGKLSRKEIEGVSDQTGQLVTDALEKAGGSASHFDRAIRQSSELSAFLEIHIEQGKRLVSEGISLGIVTSITGIYREEITVVGEANHAGTTLMNDRKDALTAACELIITLEECCLNHPADEVVGTIGKINIKPNAANIIPAEATFTAEIRGKTEIEIEEVLAAWERAIGRIKSKRNVIIKRRTFLNQKPEFMDGHLIATLKEQSELLGYSYKLLGSMAGHDAVHMATLTKSGMIFVPSIDGKSHCPEEKSLLEDMEKAANLLLQTVLNLDQKLDH